VRHPGRASLRCRQSFSSLSGSKGGAIRRFFAGLCLGLASAASAAEPAKIPPSLADLSLVELDAGLGVAVLRCPVRASDDQSRREILLIFASRPPQSLVC
jgi:hypothetical protein